MGSRFRRLVPGVVISSTTLVGTGALVVWVADQPGLKAASVKATTSAPTEQVVASNAPSVEAALAKQLQADQTEVKGLDTAMAQMLKQRKAAAAAAAAAARQSPVQAGGGGGGYGASSYPSGGGGASYSAPSGGGGVSSLGSIGNVSIPAIAPITFTPAPSLAPATNGTTGASHVVP